MLTFRKFLHWRYLRLAITLFVTSLLTVTLVNDRKSPLTRNHKAPSLIKCSSAILELGCPIPAFTAEWSIIPGVEIQIYSAHLDDRLTAEDGIQLNFVRAIGLLRKSATELKLFCVVSFPSGKQTTHRVTLDKIWLDSWDNATHKDLLTPYIISCRLDSIDEQPSSVSIVTDPCECPSNNLRLKPLQKQLDADFVVCVKGLFYPNDIGRQLKQWIEMLFILGVKHIHFYKYSVHKKTSRVLEFYEKRRAVTVQKINLPPREYPQGIGFLRNFLKRKTWEKRRLELVPYNDCYYRYKDRFKYIVLLDIDELIIPRDSDVMTWQSLITKMKEIEEELTTAYASYAFANVYFYRKQGSPMDILEQTERSANLSKPGFAIKSFFTNDGSLAVFNHYTLIPLKTKIRKCAIVGSDLALLHHYRDRCPDKMENECRDNFMKYKVHDRTIDKYREKLQQAVDKANENV